MTYENTQNQKSLLSYLGLRCVRKCEAEPGQDGDMLYCPVCRLYMGKVKT